MKKVVQQKGKMKWLKSFFRLAVPYLICILLPIMASLILAGSLTAFYQEQLLREEERKLEKSFESFCSKIDMVEKSGDSFGNDTVLLEYINATLHYDALPFSETKNLERLLLYLDSENSSVNIFYYDQINQNVIGSTAALSVPEVYFSFNYAIEGLTAQEGNAYYAGLGVGNALSPVKKVSIFGVEYQILEYSCSMPKSLYKKNITPFGQLVIAFDVNQLLSDILTIIEGRGSFILYDKNNEILFEYGDYCNLIREQSYHSSFSSFFTTAGEKYYGMSIDSGRDWKISICMSEDSIDQPVSDMGTTWALVISMTLCGLILCAYYTVKNRNEILSLLKKTTGDTSFESIPEEISLKAIDKHINKIVLENKQYKADYSNVESLKKQDALIKLIRHDYEDIQTVSYGALREYFNQGKKKVFMVLVIQFVDASYRNPVREYENSRILVLDRMLSFVGDKVVGIVNLSAKTMAGVLCFDEKNDAEEKIKELVSFINVEIVYPYQVHLKMGAGAPVESMYSLDQAFSQAEIILKYREMISDDIVLFSEFSSVSDIYFYPKEFFERICNYIVLQKTEEAKEILRKIQQENFDSEYPLSVRAIELLKNRVLENLIYIIERQGVFIEEKHLQELRATEKVTLFFEKAEQLLVTISQKNAEKKKLGEQSPVAKILEHVQLSYMDSNLSLKTLSEKFGYSESYISALFKGKYGRNVSAVIEELRIEKSCSLLRDTNKKIAVIAEEVGYTSDISFRRAFKKEKGISPTEYREV